MNAILIPHILAGLRAICGGCASPSSSPPAPFLGQQDMPEAGLKAVAQPAFG